jgi:hypothetical protein
VFRTTIIVNGAEVTWAGYPDSVVLSILDIRWNGQTIPYFWRHQEDLRNCGGDRLAHLLWILYKDNDLKNE